MEYGGTGCSKTKTLHNVLTAGVLPTNTDNIHGATDKTLTSRILHVVNIELLWLYAKDGFSLQSVFMRQSRIIMLTALQQNSKPHSKAT